MKDYVFKTKRLRLLRLGLHHVPSIIELASDYDVAKMTLNIPHPYPPESATEFVNGSRQAWDNDERYAFAIEHQDLERHIGTMGITPNLRHKHAEVGYWIGKPYWGQGYATEALQRIIQFAFEVLDLNRVHASFLTNNPASGRVMEKVGMRYEGTMRQVVRRDDIYYDLDHRAILREDYDTQN